MGTRARSLILALGGILVSGTLGFMYPRLFGSPILPVVCALLFFWLGFRVHWARPRAARIGFLLAGTGYLIGPFRDLTKIQIPVTVSTGAMLVSVFGSALAVWAAWPRRKAQVTA